MRPATSKNLIALLLTGVSALASADAVAADWNEKTSATSDALVLPSTPPLADAQTERHGMSAFSTAYQTWKNEQKRKFRMGAFPQAQERAIITYVERGECAVVNGFLFGVGWHHIPNHEQYADEDVLGYGKTIDALVEICETIKQDKNTLADWSRR